MQNFAILRKYLGFFVYVMRLLLMKHREHSGFYFQHSNAIEYAMKTPQHCEHVMLHNKTNSMSDVAKIMYLEVIDTTFSIDGVLGAFAFTMSIPLILLGNGLGAIMVRQFTIGNIERVKKYKYLKNGAMYSILGLGTIMVVDAFGVHIPSWVSPVLTFAVLGYFFWKSKKELENPVTE